METFKRLEVSAIGFVDHCKEKFGWRDLDGDVVMDVGCGEDGFCGKAILRKFPDVRAVIGIDGNPTVLLNFQRKNDTRMVCERGNIEEKATLKNFEGKMNKVISTNVFHQLLDKEKAFRNVYELLKPEGEAAILFTTADSLNEWFTAILKNPKWQNAFKNLDVLIEYDEKLGEDHYRKMVEKIGFQVIECKARERTISCQSDEDCKAYLYNFAKIKFNLPSERIDEFKNEGLQIFLNLQKTRDEKGRPCQRTKEMYMLLTKPK